MHKEFVRLPPSPSLQRFIIMFSVETKKTWEKPSAAYPTSKAFALPV